MLLDVVVYFRRQNRASRAQLIDSKWNGQVSPRKIQLVTRCRFRACTSALEVWHNVYNFSGKPHKLEAL